MMACLIKCYSDHGDLEELPTASAYGRASRTHRARPLGLFECQISQFLALIWTHQCQKNPDGNWQASLDASNTIHGCVGLRATAWNRRSTSRTHHARRSDSRKCQIPQSLALI